jgi:hypothetical protein
MKLVIFLLTVQSSQAEQTQRPGTAAECDTIQFFQSPRGNWRIRTFAIDQDVHVWELDKDIADILELARSNTEELYHGVLAEGHVIESQTLEGLRQALVARGLPANLKVSDGGFLFWAPAGTEYRMKSTPSKPQ